MKIFGVRSFIGISQDSSTPSPRSLPFSASLCFFCPGESTMSFSLSFPARELLPDSCGVSLSFQLYCPTLLLLGMKVHVGHWLKEQRFLPSKKVQASSCSCQPRAMTHFLQPPALAHSSSDCSGPPECLSSPYPTLGFCSYSAFSSCLGGPFLIRCGKLFKLLQKVWVEIGPGMWEVNRGGGEGSGGEEITVPAKFYVLITQNTRALSAPKGL